MVKQNLGYQVNHTNNYIKVTEEVYINFIINPS